MKSLYWNQKHSLYHNRCFSYTVDGGFRVTFLFPHVYDIVSRRQPEKLPIGQAAQGLFLTVNTDGVTGIGPASSPRSCSLLQIPLKDSRGMMVRSRRRVSPVSLPPASIFGISACIWKLENGPGVVAWQRETNASRIKMYPCLFRHKTLGHPNPEGRSQGPDHFYLPPDLQSHELSAVVVLLPF